MEISWNFVNPKKWELWFVTFYFRSVWTFFTVCVFRWKHGEPMVVARECARPVPVGWPSVCGKESTNGPCRTSTWTWWTCCRWTRSEGWCGSNPSPPWGRSAQHWFLSDGLYPLSPNWTILPSVSLTRLLLLPPANNVCSGWGVVGTSHASWDRWHGRVPSTLLDMGPGTLWYLLPVPLAPTDI